MTAPELMVVDWSNIVHRTFHGLGARTDLLPQDLFRASERAALDIARMVMFKGGHVVFALDGGLSGRRNIFEGYKTNRVLTDDRPPALTHALRGVWSERTSVGLFARVDGYESDDVMSALASFHTSRGGQTYILSDDGDMRQSLGDLVKIVRPRGSEDGEPFRIYDREDFWYEYGFNVGQFMRGLLTEKLTANLLAHRQQVYLNLKLVAAVPVPGIEWVYAEAMASASPVV